MLACLSCVVVTGPACGAVKSRSLPLRSPERANVTSGKRPLRKPGYRRGAGLRFPQRLACWLKLGLGHPALRSPTGRGEVYAPAQTGDRLAVAGCSSADGRYLFLLPVRSLVSCLSPCRRALTEAAVQTPRYPWPICLLASAAGRRGSASALQKDGAAGRVAVEELAHVPGWVLVCHPGPPEHCCLGTERTPQLLGTKGRREHDIQPATYIPREGSRSSAGRGACQSICMGGSCYQKGDEGRSRGYKTLGIVLRGLGWGSASMFLPPISPVRFPQPLPRTRSICGSRG